MKPFLLSVFLILTLCVSLPSEAEPSPNVTRAAFVEYIGSCITDGYIAPATPNGKFYVDFILATKKSQIYYDRLDRAEKQLFADYLWELESKYTRAKGCRLALDAMQEGSDEMAAALVYVEGL
ncbi:hypothetical protein Saratov15_00010 [Vibrio phage Saratov-15]|nr:hypothetical protein Saratov15_00010 [Vibrio phage Saratov-15]